MNLGAIRTNIKNSLYEDGVHRSNAFIDIGINEGYKLVSLLALSDERRSSVNIDGSRNFNPLPVESDSECIAPLYVANTHTGARVNASRLDQFELYASQWEGRVDGSGNTLYYTQLSPFHNSFTSLVVCPIQTIGRTQLSIIGAFIPVDLSADTDVPRLQEEFHDVLFYYGRFYALTGEPGMGQQAAEAYKSFIGKLNELVLVIKARFAGGRDYEPNPVEFQYMDVQESQQKPQEAKSESK